MPALDPFQVMEFYLSLKEHQQYLRAESEHEKCFFTGNYLKEKKGEETVDDIFCIESVKKGDQDQDGNVSEIFEDENNEDDICLDEETLFCAFIFRQ